jgi:hypothetical protein
MARPGAVMNSTSAQQVSIQALCPASAAASALALTLSRLNGSAAGSCASAHWQAIVRASAPATTRDASLRFLTTSISRSITRVSHSKRKRSRRLLTPQYPWRFTHSPSACNYLEMDDKSSPAERRWRTVYAAASTPRKGAGQEVRRGMISSAAGVTARRCRFRPCPTMSIPTTAIVRSQGRCRNHSIEGAMNSLSAFRRMIAPGSRRGCPTGRPGVWMSRPIVRRR